jgi:hypothetical protein
MPIKKPQTREQVGTEVINEIGQSNFIYDASLTSGVYADAEQLSSIFDTGNYYGNNGGNATNSGATSTKPTFVANAFGDKGGFKFQAANAQYATGPALGFAGAKTIIVVGKLDILPGSTDFNTIFSAGTVGLLSSEILVTGTGQVAYKRFVFAVNNVGTNATVGFDWTLDTSPHIFIISYNGGASTSSASYALSYDGVEQTLAISNNTNVAVALSYLGCRSPGVFHSNYTYGLVAVKNEFMSTADRLQLARSLGKQFNITTA